MTVEKLSDSDVVGFVTKFTLNDADNLAIVDGRIKLFEQEDMSGYPVRIFVLFATGFPNPLILEAQHPLLDESLGFVPNDCPLDAGLTAAFSDRF
jgi:hypothetical protein